MLIDVINDIADNVALINYKDKRRKNNIEGKEDVSQVNCNNKSLKNKRRKDHVDFVLAADNDQDPVKKQKRDNFLKNLRKRRLKISKRPFLSHDKETIFWHVYAPFDVLCDVAEDLKLHMPTVENDIKVDLWYSKHLKKLKRFWNRYDPFQIKDPYFTSPKSYFADVFDKSRLCEFYNGYNKDKLFSQADRSRLVFHILETTPCWGNNSMKCGQSHLLNENVFTASYPCHDGPILKDNEHHETSMRQKLYKEWASFKQIFKYQPIDAIKDYFGVKIAFYFDWLGFYTLFLIPASILGILCCFFGAFSLLWFEPVKEICHPKNISLFYMCPLCDKACQFYFLNETCLYAQLTHLFDNDATPFLSVLLSLWSVFYLEYWKRRQYTLSYRWHTTNFYEEEALRPEYCAAAVKEKINPVTKKNEPFISKKEYIFKICGEVSVVFLFICLVIAATMGVVIYRGAVFGVLLATHGTLRSNSRMLVTATASVISLVAINLLRYLYKYIAEKLTEWENPRTKSDFEKSFTVKMFWFQFCNTYASVFYVAFFKGSHFVGWPGHRKHLISKSIRLEGCSAQGCFLELCIQLIVLMAGQQLVGNIPEILWPYLKKKYNSWKHSIKHQHDVPIWEADYQLDCQEKHTELSLYGEYQEVVLQYGFVTMFVAAFPLAPLIALVTNLIEIRIDAINLTTGFRRPVAMLEKGIGVWYDILVTVTAFSVMVNGFIIAMASEFIPKTVYKYQFSPDGTLKGYVDWSLAYFNVNHFKDAEKPDSFTPLYQYCRFPGFHEYGPPYDYAFNKIHWEIWTIRLTFAFIFQSIVSGTARLLAWFIPDQPTSLCLKIRRQQHLSKQALKKYKIKIRKRLSDANISEDEASAEELAPRSHLKQGYKPDEIDVNQML